MTAIANICYLDSYNKTMLLRQNIGACHSNLDHIVVGFTSPDTYVIQSASLVLVLLILIFASQGLQSAL